MSIETKSFENFLESRPRPTRMIHFSQITLETRKRMFVEMYGMDYWIRLMDKYVKKNKQNK